MTKDVRFEIRLTQTLKNEVDEAAALLGISATEVMRAAISKFCAEVNATEMKEQLQAVNEFKKKLHIQ